MSTDGLLGARKLRRIERITGIKPVTGWAYGAAWEFRDEKDDHYLLCTSTLEWRKEESARHYTSCPLSAYNRRKMMREKENGQ